MDLRDRRGLVQVVIHPDDAPDAHSVAGNVRSEFVLSAVGEVAARKEGTENADMPTGDVELHVRQLESTERVQDAAVLHQ